MSDFFLAVDTSNYTTSLAVASESGIVLNKKILLPVKPGERGLRQSDAVFAHIKNIPEIFDSLEKREYKAIGYSASPRDVSGSYMPCFECGHAIAKSIGESMGIPVYSFSHQRGHIYAAAYSASFLDRVKEDFIAFHVSGGTTEVLLVKSGYPEKIGGTLDLNAGQVIDRTGVLLGLGFPCGAALEKLCDGVPEQKVKISVSGLECNLSGVENQVIKMKSSGEEDKTIAAYVLDFIGETIAALTSNALKKYGQMPVLYAGGVMADMRIRNKITPVAEAYFASPEFSCDNAAGCAILTREEYYKNS